MKTDNLASLKLYTLTDEQFKRKCATDDIEDNALYLTRYKDANSSNLLVYHPIGVGSLVAKGDSITSSDWYSICFGNGKFVAACSLGESTGGIKYSYDGISWNKADYISENLDPYSWYSVCYGNGVFVAVSYDGCFAYSADGIAWEETAQLSEGYIDVCYGNGKFVAVADDASRAIACSYDGITWEETIDYDYILCSVCYGNDKFVATGESVGTLTSTDGINWEQHDMPVLSDPWVKIAYGNGVFVVADQDASGEGPLFYSSDGINWTRANNCGYEPGQLCPDNSYSIVYCGDRFIAYNYYSTDFAISYDGVNWELLDGLVQDSSAGSGVYDICYGNDTYVAVCDTVTLLSYDGRSFGKNGRVTCNGKDVTDKLRTLIGTSSDVVTADQLNEAIYGAIGGSY